MKDNKVIMTAEGYLEAETELNELKNVRRQEIIEAIKENTNKQRIQYKYPLYPISKTPLVI